MREWALTNYCVRDSAAQVLRTHHLIDVQFLHSSSCSVAP
uniref:Uncharacterized protein n=1 Tax=Rhizophora mucronata TaxID=61149 RepID=A0A2P2IXM5_RHIMU